MKQKIKNIKRRWRKLSRLDRALLAITSILAVILLPLSPMASLCMVLTLSNIRENIICRRMGKYIYFYRIKHSLSVIKGTNRRIELLEEIIVLANKHADLLLKYNNLRAAHNKLLRRRRKENNQ